MNKGIWQWLAIIFIAVTAGACSTDTNEPAPPAASDPRGENYEPGEVTNIDSRRIAALTDAQHAFAYYTFSSLASETDKNYVFSPTSLYMAVAIMANGASGETARQIADALGATACQEIVAMSRRQIDNFAAIREAFVSSVPPFIEGMDPDVYNDILHQAQEMSTTANIANAVWLSPAFPAPYQSYVDESRKWLDTEFFTLDCPPTEIVRTINRWVNDKTNGMITKLFNEDKILVSDVILANALYINSPWRNAFGRLNEPQAFTDRSGAATAVPFIHNTGSHTYAANRTGEMVSVRLGNEEIGPDKTTPFSFTVLLPSSPVADPAELLDPDNIRELKASAAERYISLTMPEVEIETAYDDLIPLLAELGIRNAFFGPQEFDRFGPSPLCISQLIQRSKIKVDEDGVKAASVTAGFDVTDNKGERPEPYRIVIDRPYAFMITDNVTGMILFCGVVNRL